jgi:hypothetical protein
MRKGTNEISNYWDGRIYKILEKEWDSKPNSNISSIEIWIGEYNLNQWSCADAYNRVNESTSWCVNY